MSTTSTTDHFAPTTPQQVAIASIWRQLGSDFVRAVPPDIPSDATYYQQWQAAQPLVADTTAAEQALNQLTWPSGALAAKTKVIADLQMIHDFVAAPPQPSFPGAPSASSHSLSDDFAALNGDIEDLLTAVGVP